MSEADACALGKRSRQAPNLHAPERAILVARADFPTRQAGRRVSLNVELCSAFATHQEAASMGRLWGWASGRGGGRLVAESPVRGVQDRPRASCLTLHGATAVAGVGSPGDSATVRVRGRPRGERPGRARVRQAR